MASQQYKEQAVTNQLEEANNNYLWHPSYSKSRQHIKTGWKSNLLY